MFKIVKLTIFPFILGFITGYSVELIRQQVTAFLMQPLIVPIYSALIGVGMTFGATWLFDKQRELTEKKHTLQLLSEELINVSESIDYNYNVIYQDRLAAQNGLQNLSPLLILPTNNWVSIRLKNGHHLKNIFQLRDFVALYGKIARINENINNRNQFNLQNQALTTRRAKVESLDSAIYTELSSIQTNSQHLESQLNQMMK